MSGRSGAGVPERPGSKKHRFPLQKQCFSLKSIDLHCENNVFSLKKHRILSAGGRAFQRQKSPIRRPQKAKKAYISVCGTGAGSGVSGSSGESGRRLGVKNPKIPIRRPHEIKDAYKHANGKGRFFGQISRTDRDLFEFFLRKRCLSVGEIWAQKSGFAAG